MYRTRGVRHTDRQCDQSKTLFGNCFLRSLQGHCFVSFTNYLSLLSVCVGRSNHRVSNPLSSAILARLMTPAPNVIGSFSDYDSTTCSGSNPRVVMFRSKSLASASRRHLLRRARPNYFGIYFIKVQKVWKFRVFSQLGGGIHKRPRRT